uniref:Si:ch211-220f12.4 n=1 Tax=Tetraodon nigroviridis TaxID=99883 RepID=H3C469_TETNG
MEFGERKRRRKSQSFKLVTDEVIAAVVRASRKKVDLKEETKDSDWIVWVGEEGMEIKRQITGMMRLLSDKSGKVYQRVTTEQDGTSKEPQGRHLSWPQEPAPSPGDHPGHSWNSAGDPGPSPLSVPINPANGPGCGQRGTGSKAPRPKETEGPNKLHESYDSVPPAVPEVPCCMCNCKSTLQAILREMRTMRRLMMTQKVCNDKEKQAASLGQPGFGSSQTAYCRPRRRRAVYRVAQHLLSSTRKASLETLEAPPLRAPATESRQKKQEQESPTPVNDLISSRTSKPSPQHQPSEVRLAEDYDIFISKAQLDSILVNYTRSGSLLFRKLVCAFFDDATLANSLPNGKRKRGLNDNRKGLDQNIVGAIKVFTEKYCTEHRIEKLPGPRDWVQILQDQIKLARRRLKRDAAEVEEG